MNKLALPFLFLVLATGSLTVNSQVKWRKYSCSDPKFKISFPSEFIESKALDADSLPTMEVFSELESMIFSVSVSTAREPVTPVSAKYIVAGAMDNLVASLMADKVTERSIMNGKTEGIEAELLIPSGGSSITVRIFTKASYIFIVYTITLHPSADVAIKKKFLDSFKLK